METSNLFYQILPGLMTRHQRAGSFVACTKPEFEWITGRTSPSSSIASSILRCIDLKLFAPLEILTPLQYNSLMKHARNAENNLYPRSWVGPPVTGLDPPGQLAAANLLLSASMSLMTETNSLQSPMCTSPPTAAAQGGFIKLPVLVTLTAVSWGLGLVNAYFLWLRYDQERKRTQTARTRESLY